MIFLIDIKNVLLFFRMLTAVKLCLYQRNIKGGVARNPRSFPFIFLSLNDPVKICYLSHGIIDSFPRILQWRIKLLKPFLLASPWWWEPVLIQRILIGFKAILEYSLLKVKEEVLARKRKHEDTNNDAEGDINILGTIFWTY